jgi:hypothetical protein
MQIPLSPAALNEGEYPACAAMTTGVSNQVNSTLATQLVLLIKFNPFASSVFFFSGDERHAPFTRSFSVVAREPELELGVDQLRLDKLTCCVPY